MNTTIKKLQEHVQMRDSKWDIYDAIHQAIEKKLIILDEKYHHNDPQTPVLVNDFTRMIASEDIIKKGSKNTYYFFVNNYPYITIDYDKDRPGLKKTFGGKIIIDVENETVEAELHI